MDSGKAIRQYLDSSVTQPFFLVVGDAQVDRVRELLLEMGFRAVRLSECCRTEDKLPDLDSFSERLREGCGKCVALGLGEFLALQGERAAQQYLSGLKDLDLGDKKCVLLLRGVSSVIRWLQKDIRFDNRRVYMTENSAFDVTVKKTRLNIKLPDTFFTMKAFMEEMEKGRRGTLLLKTELSFPDAMITVSEIRSAHEAIQSIAPGFVLPASCGSDEQWGQLLELLNRQGGSFQKLLKEEGFDTELEVKFYEKANSAGLKRWLYFLALKSKAGQLRNKYLQYVLEKTERCGELEQNVLDAILEIDLVQDSRSAGFKEERGDLVGDFPEGRIADFVRKNRLDKEKGLYRLSDKTKVEREEIIEQLVESGSIPDYLPTLYPDLAAYLGRYDFQCGALSGLLTDYFEQYKRQKTLNRLEDAFLEQVNTYATERPYNRLPTRNQLVDGLTKEKTRLYWIDSLGVEYLAFIQELARKNKLTMKVQIGRAELPTITSINKNFFEKWPGDKQPKSDLLDKVKHDAEGAFGNRIYKAPFYLEKELGIIRAAVEEIALELNRRSVDRCYIVSDHGASRLAVLKKQEEKYETKTRGEHSGRCCQLDDFGGVTYDLPFATEENGYCILADYGRFKGSRAAVVEVHGGASLEEVVVPVIELSLGGQTSAVRLETDSLTIGYRETPELVLLTDQVLKAPMLQVQEKNYPLSEIELNRYSAQLDDITKPGEYEAKVYDSGVLIARLKFIVASKIAKIDEDFDSLF